MTPLLELVLVLALLLSAAKLAGALSVRFGQPAVLGELLVGVVLGPSVLNLFGWPVLQDPHLEDQVFHLAEIGVLLLLFNAGLEIEASELLASFRIAVIAGVLGVLVPLLLGFGLAFTGVAVLSKIVGCGLGARVAGMNGPDSLQIGIGMISRGEVGLIVASVGISSQLIGAELFAVAVLMVLLTTLITPPLLRWATRNDPPMEADALPSVEVVPPSAVAVE